MALYDPEKGNFAVETSHLVRRAWVDLLWTASKHT